MSESERNVKEVLAKTDEECDIRGAGSGQDRVRRRRGLSPLFKMSISSSRRMTRRMRQEARHTCNLSRRKRYGHVFSDGTAWCIGDG